MSIKIDGVSAATLGFKVLVDTEEPILPQTVDRIDTINGKRGIYDFGADLSYRLFEISCAVFKTGTQLQQVISAVAKALTDNEGRPKWVELTFDADPLKVYEVRYMGNLRIERLAAMSAFKLPLMAREPFARFKYNATSFNLQDYDITLDAGDFPLGSAYSFALTGSQTVSINNFGDITIPPRVDVTGTFTTFSISCNGKTLTYSQAISNQTLTIDSDKMQVYTGTTNKLNQTIGDFVQLLPGTNSVVLGGTGLNCTANFIFKPKFK